MTKEQYRKKYNKSKIKLNLNKVLKFNKLDYNQLSLNNKGNISCSEYTLNNPIIGDINYINCMNIDSKNWIDEIKNFNLHFDKETLKFFDDLIKDMWFWGIYKNIDVDSDEFKNTKYYISTAREFVLWQIYILINEIHKYIYNKHCFEYAEMLVQSNDKDIIEFVNNIFDMKQLKRNMWIICEEVIEEVK
jgi:hypothetical protein